MLKIAQEQLLQELLHCPTGSTIFCHNPSSPICSLIRFGINSFWDHAATLVWYGDIPYIVEAKGGETIHPKPLIDWIQYRLNNTFAISKATVELSRIESQYGKHYDYKAVLFYMVLYRLTGIWFGRVGDINMKTWFCFELSAWFRGKNKFWLILPKDLIN